MHYYIDCFYYSFIVDEKILNNYKISPYTLKINNNKINYLENINYNNAKKINKKIKSYKSLSNNLDKLSFYQFIDSLINNS
jgi:hypothetical protein